MTSDRFLAVWFMLAALAVVCFVGAYVYAGAA